MSTTTNLIRDDFAAARDVLARCSADTGLHDKIRRAGDLLAATLRGGGKIIACGNGGSHCDAMHFAEELSGRYRLNRPALAAIAVSDPAHLSCVANDFGYDAVFERYVEAVGREGDALLLFTSSGNSANLVRAAGIARKMGIPVVGLTGKDGGALAPLCDIELRIPHDGYADRIQELHIKIVHIMIHYIETELGY
ncbi:MAG: D-sedoheptulose 7-phosphate isomerase [Rikenellaceae bacterium]|nr:D-sedoheptulose 7-phosphate isomerase [Rikenellaceae bacterium]